jgi:signal transduction histidine kinase/ligand-binding sensor domain-containing protein
VIRRLRTLLFFLSAAFLLPTVATFAQTQALSEMQHSTWAGHDGAPLGVEAIALGPKGLLYLATIGGLYSFDGAVFEPVPIPDVVLSSILKNLYFTRRGDLLLMPSHGAPVLIHRGRGQFLNRSDGEAIENISNVQQSADGRLWAVLNEKQLVVLGKDFIWHKIPDPGAGGGHITYLFADTEGTVWVVVDDRLYRRPLHDHFLPTDVFVYGMAKFMTGLHSDLWIASSGPATSQAPARHLQHLDHAGNQIATRDIQEPLTAAYPAANGSVWLLTTQSVLVHLPPDQLAPGKGRLSVQRWNDRLALRTAVREDGAHAFLPNRDGSLWIGGFGGIEHFENATLVPLLPNATPGTWEQCSERDGAQWIMDARSNLYLRTPDGAMKLRGSGADSLDCSAFGNLLRDKAGISILNHKRINPLPALPGLKGYGNHYIFTGATRSPNGDILAVAAGGAIGRSLWRYHAGSWQQLDSVSQVSEISGIYATPTGEIYFGFRDGTAGLLQPGSTHVQAIGRINGAILGYASTRQGMFTYGTSGIAVWRRGSFTALSFADPRLATYVTGLVQSSNGGLWLNGVRGIVRVPPGELGAALRDPSHRMFANNISEGDYTGPAVTRLFGQSAQTDAKGRIWFNTLNGIVSVAPNTVKPSEPPPVVIKDLLADGAPLPSNRTLPPGVNTLSIRYVGVDFSDPSGLSYSYKLEGYDNTWQDVGTRTEAVYTHLRAGRYTFAVKARNAFGSWTSPEIMEPFVIEPHFYEERWFLATAAFLLAGLAWMLVQHRLRVAAADIRRGAEERAEERVLIARDLHDTLLQGVQGLLLTFHAAVEGVPDNHESRSSLEHALTSAEKLIVEGRDRVKGLRGNHVSGDELGQLLQAVAEDLSCSERFHLSIFRETTKTILRDDVAAEVFLVGREALINAIRHAHASHIAMRLRFDPSAFSLECEDDGIGFNPVPKGSDQKLGRWGIRGMQERIDRLHGSVHVSSEPGKGTLVQVLIKARRAYL